jgi:hypothetical protein
MTETSVASTPPLRSGGRLLAFLVLAVGFGAFAIAATVYDGALRAPLPYRDPGRLMMVEGSFKDQGEAQPFPISQMDFADWRQRSKAFSGLSLFGSLGFNLERGTSSRRLSGELVNANYLDLLGLHAAVGRFFLPEEDVKPFSTFVVVLGYDLWQSAFVGDRGVVGSEVHLNGQAYRVVGVGPRGFRGLSDQAELWVPSMLPPIPDYLNVRRERWAGAVARLAPGVTRTAAQRQLDAVTGALGATLTPLAESWFGALRQPLLRLLLAASALLLLAAWDAAGLLGGVRPVARRERWGIVLGAALAGVAIAYGLTSRLVDASGVPLQSFVPRVPGVFSVAVVVVVAALLGVPLGLPAVIENGAASRPAGRWRRAFVVVQALLAVVLLGAAGREAWTYHKTMGADLGFRRDGLLTYRMDLKGQKFMSNPLVTDLLRRQYLPRVAAVAGVRQAAMSDPTIPTDGLVGGYMTVEDHASPAPDGTYITMWHSVSPGYFETLGIPLLAGRGFTAADTADDVVVVSKAFADQQWPGKNPLGKRIKQDARGVKSEPWMTVVGVAAEAHHEGIQPDPSPAPDIYMPLFQFPLRLPLTINFLIRPQPGIPPTALVPALHREMMAIAPELPDYDAATMEDRLAKQTADARFQVTLLSLFAAATVLFAAAGYYGLRRDLPIRRDTSHTSG